MAARRDAGAARHDGAGNRDQRWAARWSRGRRRSSERGMEWQCPIRPARRATAAGADSVRRRLSIIFQRPIAGMAVRVRVALRARPKTKHPGQELPVASCPAVLTQGGDIVAGGEFLDDLDIGGQAGAGENALEQIVAEKRRVRHPPGERGLESVDVVDALAGIGALAEEVLVDVGDGGGIGIDAAHAGEDALEERTLAADRQRRRDSRLQDGIAFHDPAGCGVEARPIERMRHLADQPAHGVARQPRVGVERDDVAHVAGTAGGRVHEERGVGRAAQQPVQFVQLAALALPADPSPFACVPDAPAMKQQKARAARRRAVAPVELGDAVRRSGEESLVALRVFGRAVHPVGKSAK